MLGTITGARAALILLGVAAILTLGLLAAPEKGAVTENTFEGLRQNVRFHIEKDGVAGFVKRIHDAAGSQLISNDECHTLMHLAGHEAYLYYGGDMERIVAASDGTECIGGYIHGVEAEIVFNGTDKVGELHRLCEIIREKGINNGPCYHGVGHSAFELTKEVEDSLAICNTLSGGIEDDLSLCWRGVFSELGNQVIGFDTSSNIATPPIEYAGLSKEEPYAFCEGLAERYRYACYTQLSKFFFASADLDSSFARCVAPAHSEEQQAICMNILSGMATRLLLSFEDSISAPHILDTLPVALQKAAVDGFAESFGGYLRSGYQREWRPYCDSFSRSAVRAYCEDSLDHS